MSAQKIGVAVAAVMAGGLLLPALAHAEQWAYAMQTGHGDHSIQVDVDSLAHKQGYIAARLLYQYYPNEGSASEPASATVHSAVVEGAFDCKGRRFQTLSRTQYAAAQAKGAAGPTVHSDLAAERWKLASADPETFAIIDWVCSVATHKLAQDQAGSKP
ncbi:MAG TPA: surface-adhesin E family protein [Steroidobacteraceae bacterium]